MSDLRVGDRVPYIFVKCCIMLARPENLRRFTNDLAPIESEELLPSRIDVNDFSRVIRDHYCVVAVRKSPEINAAWIGLDTIGHRS